MTVTDWDPFETIRNALWIWRWQWAVQDVAAVADTVAGHFLPHLPISA